MDTQTALSVASSAAPAPGDNENNSIEYRPAPLLFGTPPPKPFSLAPGLAQAREAGVYDTGIFFAIELGELSGLNGRRAQLWSQADCPLIGEWAGRTFWGHDTMPALFTVARMDDTVFAEPNPLVFIVRRGHEQADYAALLEHLTTNGLPSKRGAFPLFTPIPGEPNLWIDAVTELASLPTETGGPDNG